MSKVKHKHTYLIIGIITAVLTVIASATANLLRAENVEAAASFNYNSCLNGYTVNGEAIVGADVLSIKNACTYCQNNNGGPYGVLWFNDSATSAQGNTIRIDSWGEETKSVHLWGGVFSCNNPSGSDNWANYVWFGLPGEMKGNGTTIDKMEGAAPFFDLTQSYYGDSVYRAVFRGKVSGSKYTWSNFGVSPTTSKPNAYLLPNVAAFYPKKFREEAMKVGGCSDIVEGGVTKLKCVMNISVNRCYNDSLGKYFNNTGVGGSSTCYGDDSEIILIAPPYNDGGFSSKSKVSADAGTNESPNWDQDAPTLEIEADSSGNATVKFAHKLQYVAESPSGNYNNASTDWTITIDDGSGGPWTGTYSTPGGANAESSWLPETGEITTTVSLGSADEKTVCSTITYTPKSVQWDSNDPRNMMLNTDPNNKGSTKACAKITRSSTEEVGSVEFWSRSHVESVAANDVKYHKASTHDNFSGTTRIDGDKVTLRLSTDWPSAQANFRHDLGFEIKLADGISFGTNDTIDFSEMCTKWKIESAETSGNGAEGEYCADSKTSGKKLDVHVTSNHTVNIGSAGSEASAEEKITYKMKKVPILRSEIKTNACGTGPETYTCSYNPKRWKYYAEDGAGSGEGSSAARIEYVRPTEPTGNGPSSGGASDAKPMYAGETTQMSWDAQADPKDVRRVMQYQSIAFIPKVSKKLEEAKVKGTYQDPVPGASYPYRVGYNQDPCTFWEATSRLGLFRSEAGGCAQVTSPAVLTHDFGPKGSYDEVSETNLNATVSAGETMAVPDWVGDKYCNSFGYQWEYFYGIKNSKGANADKWTWTRDNQSYWVHYNAACRSIAKKPSVALWNGGLFVGTGDVVASTSPRRIPSPQVGDTAADSKFNIYYYGSWSEYLANVNGSVGGASGLPIPGLNSGLFASAASYAWNGSSKTSAPENSVLTIQNYDSSMLGKSGVGANSALMARLKAYFEKAQTNSENTIGAMPDVNDSRIYYVNGDAHITGNITISTATKNSIFQLPQVVIFAAGDINIDPSVTQIDAWLIAEGAVSGGKIDTCYNSYNTSFIKKETQARVDTGLGGQANPDVRNNACQEKLIINGPVLAKTITTTRSFGSDGISNTDEDSDNAINTRAVPAEVFNLSAENYLWAYAQAGRYNSSYTEAYSRELPPRY